MSIKKQLTFILIAVLFLTVSCSRKGKRANTTFEVSTSQLVNGTQMTGGLYLWAVPVGGAPPLMFDLDADDSASIPFGEYHLHVVGYEGPAAWQGNNQCGGTPNAVLLEDAEVTITINLTAGECGVLPVYADMMAEKAASLTAPNNWDTAVWDQSTWGP